MKLDIFMAVPGLPFDGDTIYKGSLGGSESAGAYMARELARIGHRVTMFSNCEKEGTFEKVCYIPISNFQNAASLVPHDVCIVQRSPQLFATTKASKLNILWQHDLALKREEQNFRGSLWNIDGVFVLSKFMAEQYKEVFGVDSPTVHVTRNGIDLEMFKAVKNIARNRKRLFYAARPERGLDVLLEKIMPCLWAIDPEITLAVAGYSNDVGHLAPFYEHCNQLIAQSKGRVVNLGALSKSELYAQLAAAAVYAYPTPSAINANFAEVSCILAMEAQACGTPVVTSSRGALPETVYGGILVDGDVKSEEYVDNFADSVLRAMDGDVHRELSDKGKIRAATLDWSGVAHDWAGYFEAKICENNDSAERLAVHFVKRSDVDAVDQLLTHAAFKDGQFKAELIQHLSEQYAFTENEDVYNEHYRAHGEDTLKQLAAHPVEAYRERVINNTEPRFQYVEKFIKSKGINTVLDYGCGHGWMPVYLHNRTGISVHGVDVDPGAIEWCSKFSDAFATERSALSFSSGLDTAPMPANSVATHYDCVICSEVLEHVLDPLALITKLERYVRPGGYVLFTVPYGPAEYATPHWYNFRNHLREWDLHDLHDIFGMRKDFAVGAVFSHNNEITKEPVGCWVGVYEVTGKEGPIGSIDWDRKLALQRPMQTVSLNIMAGPGSGEQIRWMLNSVKDVANEIVIADTGMTPQDIQATSGFAIKRVAAPDPKVAGFETPRNIGLELCTMDWILWLDTDEKMLESFNVFKYLRDNSFNGYGIRQHHFAADTTFTPDMPVRLFRRNPRNGKKLKWVGMIHEHPELGVNEGPGDVIIVSDINIAHTGYLVESGRRQRFARNFPLLMADVEKYPDRTLQKHFIMRDKVQISAHKLQSNGGIVTTDIEKDCRDVVDLYRKYFCGKHVFMSVDSQHWYSEALKILGEGFEVSMSFTVAHATAPSEPARATRYACKEDFTKDLMAKVDGQIDPLLHRYF